MVYQQNYEETTQENIGMDQEMDMGMDESPEQV
jgi:hypothetical protein